MKYERGIGSGLGPDNPNWVPSIQRICHQCGQPFERKPWQVSRNGHGGKFCSLPCYRRFKTERQSGPNAPDWVGGEVTYRGKDWKRVRLEVVRQQQGCCGNCGTYVGDSLPINHIRPFRDFLLSEVANQPKNLIGLCPPCHMRLEWSVWRSNGIKRMGGLPRKQ